MAMTYNAQNAPMGAVTIYRISSALSSVATNMLQWNTKRTMTAEFSALSPRELEDIGLVAASKDAKGPGIFAKASVWAKDKIDSARTARELSTLSPKMLEDIGMTGADVEAIHARASIL